VDADLFEDLEELLIQADVNVNTTMRILDNLRAAVQDERMVNSGRSRIACGAFCSICWKAQGTTR